MGFLQPAVQTPHIDALAARGVYFPNAVVASSLCSPSRATILTGQMARNHGVVDNNLSSEEGLVFFPRYLQDAGYETGFFGKWHMGNASDAPRDGFDRWVSFAGQGFYYPVTRPDGSVNTINVDGVNVPQQGYITDELTDYLLAWLEEGRDGDRPFFAYLSHKAVHSDAVPAPRHRGRYDDTEFALPETVAISDEYLEGKPMWVKNQRNSWHGIDFFYASDRKMTDYLRDYYGALAAVDDSLGRIWSYLEDNDLEEETLVVFYSDNGFLIGDHGLIDKRNAYEGSVRVPMVVAAPGLLPAGVSNDAMVRNLDLAPTFLEVAGIAAPAQFEGKSWLPVATGAQTLEAWGEPDFIYEYFWEWSFPMTPTTFAIQRGPLKYIQYHGVWDIEELYDVDADPLEVHNLINDPAYYETRQALRVALYEQLESADGHHAVPYHARLAEGMNLRRADGDGAAAFPDAWKVEPNRPDRLNGLLPDTAEKKRYLDAGKPYLPWLIDRSKEQAND
jgi:arylsulfatase A-like enzyme